jgi:hypothetical protein
MGIRGTLHHHQPEAPVDPNRPHPFKALAEHWVVAGVPPASLAGSVEGAPAAIGAGLEFADHHCVVCRRDPSDPIHAMAD